MKFFISYTVRDKQVTRGMLETFSSMLKAFGKVYIDLLDNDSEEKQERVISELTSSDIFILIESKEAYASPWVNLELELAASKGLEIHLVPFITFKQLLESNIPIESLLPSGSNKK